MITIKKCHDLVLQDRIKELEKLITGIKEILDNDKLCFSKIDITHINDKKECVILLEDSKTKDVYCLATDDYYNHLQASKKLKDVNYV